MMTRTSHWLVDGVFSDLIQTIVPEPIVFEQNRGKGAPKGGAGPIDRARDQGFENEIGKDRELDRWELF